MAIRKHIALATFATLFLLTLAAPADYGQQRQTLVTIGYADEHTSFWNEIGFGSYRHRSDISALTEEKLLNFLTTEKQMNCKETILKDAVVHICESVDQAVLLVNANFPCPDEDVQGWNLRPYRKECRAQRLQSEAVKHLVKSKIFSFDNFVYVGHARGGQGLSFLNKAEQIEFLNLSRIYDEVPGPFRLRNVVLASCDSISHYSHSFWRPFRQSNISFDGMSGERKWVGEMVPFAIESLRRLL